MGADSWLGVELRHFLALEAVAREGSFGKAATALGYTQSAVSQQIATLERIVGHRLIERPGGPKPVSLTEAGDLLLTHAGAISARIAAAQADLTALAEGQAGTLRVGVFQSVGQRILPEVMRRFVAAWPQVTVTLTESADDLELLGLVERGDLDLTFADLAQLESDGRRRLRFVFRSDHNQTVQALVASGVGSALVPRLTMDPDDETTELIELPKVQPRLISFAWHRDRYRTAAARAFVDTAQAVCVELELEPALT